ncbi:MAG: 50S ribosomal protein L18 [Patescibacteria group bacterium]
MLLKQLKRLRRHKKIRIKCHGTKDRPRLCVFRSLSHIYAQLINDDTACVLAFASDKETKINQGLLREKDEKMTNKVLTAFLVGKLIAKKAEAQKIQRVVFDRGGIIFHGRVKALADGAREGGLKF